MQIQSILQQAGNYFLEPWALALLAGIIPLAIIYLVKPKPKEMMLPSLRFFMEGKKESKIRSAIRRIQRNIFLILHLLLISGLAVAAAQPYITGDIRPEKSVLILDRSASMNDDFQQAKDFLRQNTGNRNTLILVDDGSRVILQNAQPSQIRTELSGLEPVQTSTDIASALREAVSRDGEIFIASDLDHSTGEQDVNSLISSLQASRNVEIMESDQQNSWGIVRATPGRTTELDVENFGDETQQVKITYGSKETSVKLQPGEVKTLNLEMETGRNAISLEEDGYQPDNTFRVFVPEQKSFRTVIIGENSYLEKTFELINFTQVETVDAGSNNVPDADIYVLTDNTNILPATREGVVAKAPESLVIVQQSQDNFKALGLEGEPGNKQVTVTDPVNTYIGETSVLNVSSTGYTPMSKPGNAIMKGGNNSILVYNIRDQEFRNQFLYPVFWKRAVADMTKTPTVDNRNIMTGERIDGRRMLEQGFQEIGGETYAVNHVNRDESVTERNFVRKPNSATVQGEKNIAYIVALLLLGLVLGEYAYLDRQGDLE